MNEDNEYSRLLVDLHRSRDSRIDISPAWLATEAMCQLDPDKRSPQQVYLAAHLYLRQLARSICRKKHEHGDSDQHDMFPDLQARYPTAHSADAEEPQYRKLEYLTEADVIFNVNRLRCEAQSKLAHADALEAWWQHRLSPTG